MDRRTAMFLTMLLGGFAPRALLAQDTERRPSTRGRSGNLALKPARAKRSRNDEPVDGPDPEPASDAEGAGGLPPEPGQQWKTFDISRYTNLAHNQTAPQNAIVEWIFRRTGTAPWHGERIAVLSASRTQLRVYQNAKTLQDVAEMVERFTNATHDILSLRVRIVAAVDTRWRYSTYTRLTQVGNGPQGQQVWTLKTEDSAFVLAQMQIYQGFHLLADQVYNMVNGQTLTSTTSTKRGFAGGLQRESAAGLGYQPRADQIEEGVVLRVSPLLTFEGDAIDVAIDLTANNVRSFHRTRVIAPREIGQNELTIDVPEVSETRLNQKVNGWPLGQTLLISGGIQPGILGSKGGFMNLRIPGTVPTSTELLVFLDAEVSNRPRTATRDQDREREE